MKQGKIRAISKKTNGSTSFTTEEEPEVWYSGFGFDAQKGDLVSFEHIVNKGFNNFKDLKVIQKAQQPPLTSFSKVNETYRTHIDAGNIIQNAVAMYTTDEGDRNFSDYVNTAFGEFIRVLEELKKYGDATSNDESGETK